MTVVSGPENFSSSHFVVDANGMVSLISDPIDTTGGTVDGSLYIMASGKIGVGTTTPAAKVTIVDESNAGFEFDEYAGYGAIMRLFSARGTPAAPSPTLANDLLGSLRAGGYYTSAFTPAARTQFNAFAAEDFTATANGTYITLATTPIGSIASAEVVRIDSSGNVGIGSAGPQAKLHVYGATNPAAAIDGPGNTTRALQFRTAGAMRWSAFANAGETGGNVGGDYLINAFDDAGAFLSTAFSIQRATGHVGINMADPAVPLGDTAYGTILAVRGTGAYSLLKLVKSTTGSNEMGRISFGSPGYTGAEKRTAIIRSMSETTATDNPTGNLGFLTTNAGTIAERLRITGAGNVGIGTTAPLSKLVVSANASGLAPSTGITGTLAQIVGADTTSPRLAISGYGGLGVLDLSRANGTAAAATALASQDIVGAIVGLGYDGSSYAGASSIYFSASEAWTTGAHGGAMRFLTTPNGTTTQQERVRIAQNGYVGILTTAPQTALDVFGSVRTTSRTVPAAGTGPGVEFFLQSGIGYIEAYDRTAAVNIPLSLNATNIALMGNVGVGFGTPGYRLDVAGDANVSGVYRIGGVGIVQVSSGYTFLQDGGGTNTILLGSSDPNNYHRNGAHIFQNRAGSVTYATINAAGLNLGAVTVTNLTVNGSGWNALSVPSGGITASGVYSLASGLRTTGPLTLEGTTSNLISFGTTGVAPPGAGSAGEKIQLYGGLGSVTATDFALGIENSHMWFNSQSAGGFKWYLSSGHLATLNTTGLGLGGSNIAPSYTLDMIGSARVRHTTIIGVGVAGSSLFFSDGQPVNIAELQSTNFNGSYGINIRGWNGGLATIASFRGDGYVGIGNTNPQGRLHISGVTNGANILYIMRATDTSPSGYFILCNNAAASATLFSVDAIGATTIGGALTVNSTVNLAAGNAYYVASRPVVSGDANYTYLYDPSAAINVFLSNASINTNSYRSDTHAFQNRAGTINRGVFDGNGLTVTGAVSASTNLQIGSTSVINLSSGYTCLYDATGGQHLLGGASVPANYWRNDAHYFQTRAGGLVMTVNTGGLVMATGDIITPTSGNIQLQSADTSTGSIKVGNFGHTISRRSSDGSLMITNGQGNIVLNGNVTSGNIAAASAQISASALATTGAGAILWMNDRTTNRQWGWYGSGDSLFLFNGSGNITSCDPSGNWSANSYKIAGATVLSAAGGYTRVFDGNGAPGAGTIVFGPAGDPSNYYQNDNHYFFNRAGNVQYGYFASGSFYTTVACVLGGTAAGLYPVQINGQCLPITDAVNKGGLVCGASGQAWGAMQSYAYNTSSDARLKRDIEDVPDCLDLVTAVRARRYRWISEHLDDREHWGFIAQEVRAAMEARGHDFAAYSNDAGDHPALAYNELVAVLWRGVQQLAERLATVEARLAA